MAVGEHDVAGEHGAVAGDIDQDVAGGVRRADLDQLHVLVADRQIEPLVERFARQRQRDAREVELAAEVLVHELAGVAERLPVLQLLASGVDVDLHHLVVAFGRGDDLRALDQLVAEGVVGVGVGVDQHADVPGRAAPRGASSSSISRVSLRS